MKQRLIVGLSAAFPIGLLLWALLAPAPGAVRKTIILGVDGMDPILVRKFVDEGRLPHCEALMARGDFKPLQTTMPPLSPVAWSTFITGLDPGGHAIFDFFQRDPQTMKPTFSMARTATPGRSIAIGSWLIPLGGGTVEPSRRGRAFWEILEAHQVPTTIFRMPVNFPPRSPGKSLSGMGTPDISGTPGTFSFYTDMPRYAFEDMAGGRFLPVEIRDNRFSTHLIGPRNRHRRSQPEMTVDFHVRLDPGAGVARFVVQDTEFQLEEGQWSDWVRVDFEAVPYLVQISAIARFYLQEIEPDFRLYVTPLQINPENPILPISTPEEWAGELQRELGYFYTQELAEDTAALSSGVFEDREFWDQLQYVYREQREALDHLLSEFQEGLLFFYLSSLDQGSHMLWRYMDLEHPASSPDASLRNSLRVLYEQVDEALGRTLEFTDEETTLIVMSDHGFAPFYWGVNLNSWLAQKGYVTLKDPDAAGDDHLFANVDWTRTRAYALGLSGIYVNLKGRERDGTISPGAEYEELLDQLEIDLLALRDARNGQRPIRSLVRSSRDFRGDYVKQGPDLIVGYDWGYRSSWSSPLGEFPPQIFVDNVEPWSGDHSVDATLVPGLLLTNRSITLADPALQDLTVAILDEYGISKPPEMRGRDCLQ